MKTKSKKTKSLKQVKVTVEWTDETFDRQECAEMVINLKKKEAMKYPIKGERIYGCDN